MKLKMKLMNEWDSVYKTVNAIATRTSAHIREIYNTASRNTVRSAALSIATAGTTLLTAHYMDGNFPLYIPIISTAFACTSIGNYYLNDKPAINPKRAKIIPLNAHVESQLIIKALANNENEEDGYARIQSPLKIASINPNVKMEGDFKGTQHQQLPPVVQIQPQ